MGKLFGASERLRELREALSAMELAEPEDIRSDAYDRWEEECGALEERIAELSEEIAAFEDPKDD